MRAELAPPRRPWRAGYVRRLRLTDAAVVSSAVLGAQFVRFGFDDNSTRVPLTNNGLTYTAVSVALIGAWLTVLALVQSRTPRIVGLGTEEYKRVIESSFWIFGGIAIVSLVARADFARGYLAVALPAGLVGLLGSRWAWRQSLVRRRRQRGEAMSGVVVIGTPEMVSEIADRYGQFPENGYRVVGACVPNYWGKRGRMIEADGVLVPIFGDETTVIEAITYFAADCVAVASAEHLSSESLRQLIWLLEPHDIDLVITPGVADIAGPRLVLEAGADLSMIHVSKPSYTGAERSAKHVIDLVVGSAASLLAALPMVVIAVAIRLTSPGPVLLRADSVGRLGKPFQTIKFRTRYVDDPELGLTPIGRFLDRYHLDQLPMLLNVLRREMSMVGPKAPDPAHLTVDDDDEVKRRLLVRPGLTGLWQLAGGREIGWEQGVRLDVNYVENWSLFTDLVIILKTVVAIFRPAKDRVS